MAKTIREALEVFCDQKAIHNFEGRKGVENLCRVARACGYKDPQYWGQMTSQACVGDLIAFFEDNSGAVEAVLMWINKQRSPEMLEALNSAID